MKQIAALKDETLNQIAEQGGNVAQFVSFGPDGKQRFMRIRDVGITSHFGDLLRRDKIPSKLKRVAVFAYPQPHAV